MCRAIFIFLLALVGVFYPYNRGSLYTALVVIYALTSGIAGYTAASFYKMLDGTNWVSCFFLFTCKYLRFFVFAVQCPYIVSVICSISVPLWMPCLCSSLSAGIFQCVIVLPLSFWFPLTAAIIFSLVHCLAFPRAKVLPTFGLFH